MRRKWTGIPACLVLWDRLSFVCPLCVCGCAASGQAFLPVLFCRTDILVCPLCVCGCAASGQAFLPVLFCGTDFLLSVHFVFADAPQVDRHYCLSCFVGQTFFCLSTLCLRMRRKWTGIPACLVLWDRLSFVCPLCVCGCAASGQALLPVLFCRTDILLSVHFVFADAPQVDRQECLSCFVGQTFFCLSTLCLRMRRKWTGIPACLVL